MPAARKINELDYVTGEVICTFNTVTDACKAHNLMPRSIYNALVNRNGCLHRKKLKFEYAESYEIKKVQQLDYETGEVIETYDSAQAAAIDNYIYPQVLRYALKEQGGVMDKKQLRFRYVD